MICVVHAAEPTASSPIAVKTMVADLFKPWHRFESMFQQRLKSNELEFVRSQNHALDEASTFEEWQRIISDQDRNSIYFFAINRQILDHQVSRAVRFGDDFIAWFDQMIQTKNLDYWIGQNKDVTPVNIFAEILQRVPQATRNYQGFIEEIVYLLGSPKDQIFVSFRLARSFVNSERGELSISPPSPFWRFARQNDFADPPMVTISSVAYYSLLKKKMMIRILAKACEQGAVLHLSRQEFARVTAAARSVGFQLKGKPDWAKVVRGTSMVSRCLQLLAPQSGRLRTLL